MSLVDMFCPYFVADQDFTSKVFVLLGGLLLIQDILFLVSFLFLCVLLSFI